MSVIHTILSSSEVKRISQTDRDYLQRQLKEHTILNRLLNRPVNQHLLHELQCLLDKQPLPRQESGQFVRGQVSRLTDGVRRPCIVRKMTAEERINYRVKEAK